VGLLLLKLSRPVISCVRSVGVDAVVVVSVTNSCSCAFIRVVYLLYFHLLVLVLHELVSLRNWRDAAFIFETLSIFSAASFSSRIPKML
jgi:hypothetical protein